MARAAVPALAGAILLFLLWFGMGTSAQAQPIAHPSIRCGTQTSDSACFHVEKLTDRILYCANRRRYYVFFPYASRRLDDYCLNIRNDEGGDAARAATQTRLDALIATLNRDFYNGGRDICDRGADRSQSSRIASDDVLKQVLSDPRLRDDRGAVGLIGGVFCERLWLYGLKLDRSLVFDHSIFLKGIELHYIAGAPGLSNLSLNDTLSAGGIELHRSELSGLFLHNLVARSVLISESAIGLTLDLDFAQIFDTLTLRRSKIARSISMQGARLGQVAITGVESGGTMTLDGAVVLGAVKIDRSRIAEDVQLTHALLSAIDIVQNDIKFDFSLSGSELRCRAAIARNTIGGDIEMAGNTTRARSWSRESVDLIAQDFRASPLDRSTGKDAQWYWKARALIPRTTCKTEQTAPSNDLLFENNKVDGGLCLQTAGFFQYDTRRRGAPSSLLSLRGSSVGKNSILLDQPPGGPKLAGSDGTLDLSGFRTGGLIVDFDSAGERSQPMLTTGLRFDELFSGKAPCTGGNQVRYNRSGGNSANGDVTLPAMASFLRWADRGNSSDPIASAMDAFDRLGIDTTNLKVAIADRKFHADLDSRFNPDSQQFSWNPLDYLAIAATAGLKFIADFGYRPQKAIILIALAILLFYWIISRKLKIRTALTDVHHREVKVSWLFILDTMIPGYQIDEAHFKVVEYRFANGTAIDPATEKRLFTTLQWIKIVGVIFAVFVAAALKTLVVG